MDKHDARHDGTYTAAAATRSDPAGSHTPGDHCPRTSQDHPAQAGAAGQSAEMADRDSIRIVGDEHGPVGDHLHIASRTDLRRR